MTLAKNLHVAAFVTVFIPGVTGSPSASQTTELPPATATSTERTSPQRLKDQAHITVETNVVAATAATNPPALPTKSLKWKFSWHGWDGLHTEISQKTPVKDPLAGWREKIKGTNAYRVFHLEELKMNGKFGAKLAVDAAAYATGHEFTGFDPGIELRRARAYWKGDCLIVLPVSYELEIGYIPNQIYLEETYLAFRDIPHVGEFKGGQYHAPMGLDAVTSTRDISFMEPASPIAALAPGNSAGIQIDRPFLDKRATWALGLFTDGVGKDFGDASRDYGRAITRLTCLPIYHPDPDWPGASRLLHLGISANYLYSGSSSVRYRSRPESHLAPYVVDTGEISSHKAMTLGAEAAWVNGPFSIQGEYLHSFVDQTDAGTLNFEGFYASAIWFLTGESRPYNRSEGKFDRVIPRRNFNWGRGGWGAWEIAGRISHLDLDSGNIHGGRMLMGMAGVNWYLHSHVKWRFDYGFGHVSERTPEGNLHVFQTRVEMDF